MFRQIPRSEFLSALARVSHAIPRSAEHIHHRLGFEHLAGKLFLYGTDGHRIALAELRGVETPEAGRDPWPPVGLPMQALDLLMSGNHAGQGLALDFTPAPAAQDDDTITAVMNETTVIVKDPRRRLRVPASPPVFAGVSRATANAVVPRKALLTVLKLVPAGAHVSLQSVAGAAGGLFVRFRVQTGTTKDATKTTVGLWGSFGEVIKVEGSRGLRDNAPVSLNGDYLVDAVKPKQPPIEVSGKPRQPSRYSDEIHLSFTGGMYPVGFFDEGNEDRCLVMPVRA